MSSIHRDWSEDSGSARLWRTVTGLAEERGVEISVDFLCDLVAERLGASVCVVLAAKADGGQLRYSTDDLAVRLAELEVTVGEGPVGESLRMASSLFITDLDTTTGVHRWPLFAPLAVEAGARACFLFPLSLGVVRAGVLAAYAAEPGSPGPEKLGDALLFAELLLAVTLAEQAGIATLPSETEGDSPMVGPEVHQAAGMVAVQLDVDLADAFARLRARAFADGRRLADLAADVVARRLRFEPEPDTG